MFETKILNEKTRSRAPGSFVELSKGMVHYELTGPGDGQTVVLVHGALTPMFVWDYLAPELCSAGFRVLRYDNYGRGWSDRPRARYDDDLYVAQLVELLEELDIEQPVHLVGVSQGGAISTAFSARNPDRAAKVVLLAPAGLPWKRELAEHFGELPGCGGFIVSVAGPAIIRKGLHRNFTDVSNVDRLRPLISDQMQYRGFRRSVLAMLRQFPMGGLEHDFAIMGRQDRDVLLVWGTADKILPFDLSRIARELLPRAEFHVVEEGSHIAHWEQPEAVNPVILGFLQRS